MASTQVLTRLPPLHPYLALASSQDRAQDAQTTFDYSFKPSASLNHRLSAILDRLDHDPLEWLVSSLATFVSKLAGNDLEDVAFRLAIRNQLFVTTMPNGKPSLHRTHSSQHSHGFSFLLDWASSHQDSTSEEEADLKVSILLDPDANQVNLSVVFNQPGLPLPREAATSLGSSLLSTVFKITGHHAWRPSVANHPPSSTRDVEQASHLLLHQAFIQQAQLHPERIAIQFSKRSSSGKPSQPTSFTTLTYRELYVRASAVACELAHAVSAMTSKDGHENPTQQVVIPMLLSPSIELYVSYLAILMAGFAFCPLAIDAPDLRLAGLVEQLQAPFVLGANSDDPPIWLSSIQSGGQSPRWINVTSILASITPSGPDPVQHLFNLVEDRRISIIDRPPKSSAESCAYVLFTSGTTGKPKGVMISHRSAANSIRSHTAHLPEPLAKNKQGFKWFQFITTTFDPSVLEIFVTLSSGGTLCSACRELTLSEIEMVVRESGAEILAATPSVAALLDPAHVPQLKYLWTMGESLNSTVIQRFAASQDRSLANAYGPTEASINCTLLQPFPHDFRGTIIGEPLETCSLAIVDQTPEGLTPVPMGMTGELVIGGSHVGMGYIGMPEQTKEVFTEMKHLGRVYRTQDRARFVWTKEGRPMIEILGRMNAEQVKLSGKRVELGEIEAVLQQASGVQRLACVVYRASERSGTSGSELLIACIVPSSSSPSWDLVRQECDCIASTELPSHMRPNEYLFMEQLPMSASGKSDRKQLNSIVADILAKDNEHRKGQQQRNTDCVQDWKDLWGSPVLEAMLAEIGTVCALNPACIAPNSRLFHLGLDSLAAMRLIQNLKKDSGTKHAAQQLSVATVLSCRDCRHLADCLTAGSQQESQPRSLDWTSVSDNFASQNIAVARSAIETLDEPCQIKRIFPTTATQSGMLSSFLMRSRTASAEAISPKSYIYHSIYHLGTDVDSKRLFEAFRDTMLSHDIFNTSFVPVDDPLAPFAQCILQGWDASSNLSVTSTGLGNETQNALENHLRQVEATFGLERPPWHLGLYHDLTTSRGGSMVILSMMHAIFDGGSLDILQQEVCCRFAALPESSLSSIGHVSELESAVRHHFITDADATRDYWGKQLKDIPPTAFPCVNGNKSISSSTSSDLSTSAVVEIASSSSMPRLVERAQRMETSASVLLQTAWNLLLASYAEDEDQTVFTSGSVQSGRLDEDTRLCMAPTFNIVPFIVRLHKDGDDPITVQTLIDAATIDAATALQHLEVPLGSLSRRIDTGSGLPFDTLFAVQRFDTLKLEHGDGTELGAVPCPWNAVSHPTMANDFAIMVEIWPNLNEAEPVTLRLTYSDAVLDIGSATLLLAQYDDILHRMMEDPDRTLALDVVHGVGLRSSALAIANPEPQSDILCPSDYASPTLLHSDFESHTRYHPDDVALEFWNGTSGTKDDRVRLTYQQLDARAAKLAEQLLASTGQGSLHNQPIPICMERCVELYVTILAILKSGGAWCPIDVQSPLNRQLELIQRTNSKVVIVTPSTSTLLGEVSGLRKLVASTETCTETPSLPATRKASPDDLAYLIWTSGTTGAPKGVMIQHSSAVTSMRALQYHVKTLSNSPPRCLQFSSYTFDVFVQDLFWTWGLGGTVVAATREVMLASTAELVAIAGVDHAHLTPAFAAGLSRASCPSITSVTFIGEKLTEAVAHDWTNSGPDQADLPPIAVYNTYGPAEVTVVATLRKLQADETVQSANVGPPMASVSAFVCKRKVTGGAFQPCPKGTVGELVLGGPQVGRGYLSDPIKTRSAFVPSQEWKQTLYFTGDYVRMLHDGSIEFIGRRDDLVKLGGIRVELSEISASLGSLELVSQRMDRVETMLLSRSDRPTKQVVSFLTCSALTTTSSDRDSLLIDSAEAISLAQSAAMGARQLLPSYMVPAVVLVIVEIPQTASAKIDRVKLKQAYEEADLGRWSLQELKSSDGPIDEAVLGVERSVKEAIFEITGTPLAEIGGDSSLASIGLDSIRAIRLAAKLKRQGLTMPISQILSSQTVRILASRFTSEGRACGNSHAGQVTDNAESGQNLALSQKLQSFGQEARACLDGSATQRTSPWLPCSLLQEGMLAESLATPTAYWSDHLLRLDVDTSIDDLKHAWQLVQATVEVLRVVFVVPSLSIETLLAFDGGHTSFAVQKVLSHASDGMVEDEVGVVNSSDELNDALSKWRTQLACARLEQGFSLPLWGVKFFDLESKGQSSTFMGFAIHHALYDGPSIQVLFSYIQDQYLALRRGQRFCLSNEQLASSCSLADQLKHCFLFTAEEQEKSLNYWTSLLKPRGAASQIPDLTSFRSESKSSNALLPSFLVASESIEMDLDRLRSVQSKSLAGLTTILKTCFAMILAQYIEPEQADDGIGSRHILLGEIVSERGQHGSLSIPHAIGPLLSTLPFSVSVGKNEEQGSIDNLLKQAGQQARDTAIHRFAPLPQLAKVMAMPSGAEMFTAMFVYHPEDLDTDQTGSTSDQVWSEVERESSIHVEHGAVLNVFEQKASEGIQSLKLELSIKEHRIGQNMLSTMLRQVAGLIEAVVACDNEKSWQDLLHDFLTLQLQSVSTISRQTSASRGVYTGSKPSFWLEHFAQEKPHWPAVIIAESAEDGLITEASIKTWTFGELNERASQLASLIASLQLPPGPIALCMNRSLISMAAFVAIFKTARTYLPIEDQLPAERKRLLIEDSNCALVLTEGHCLAGVDIHTCRVLNVGEPGFAEKLQDQPRLGMQAPDDERSEDGYLLYTSGSTGKPKGVRVSSQNLCSFIESYVEVMSRECPATLSLGGKGRYLGLASRAFDVHLSQTFTAWRFGMALATGSRPLLLGDLKATIQTLGISHLSCVPSLLDQCDLVPGDLPSLVFLGVGGEKMTERVRDNLCTQLPVLNAYGPTETTIMCTVNRVIPTSHVRDIGFVLPGNTAMVVDFNDTVDLKPVLRGRPGELCIQGDLVALGYNNLDGVGSKANGFVTTRDGARMYRTGDAARMMADGRIHYLGRRDEQEKIRGQRLELGEVSQCAIAGSGGLLNASTVICKPQGLSKPLLVTLVALRRGTSADRGIGASSLPAIQGANSEMGLLAQKVKLHCDQQLPAYMVPDIVVPVSHLTSLPTSGKTDTRKIKTWLASMPLHHLFSLCGSGLEASASPDANRQERMLSSAEEQVVKVIRRIMPSPMPIHPETSIFELGFDSLSVIRLAGSLRKASVPVLSIGHLRNHPRICDIAETVDDENQHSSLDLSVGKAAVAAFNARHVDSVVRVLGKGVDRVIPCLPVQEGMVALSLSSTDPVYVASMHVHLEAGTAEEGERLSHFKRSVLQLARQHSILRTCFEHVNDATIAQVVLKDVIIDSHVVTISDHFSGQDKGRLTRDLLANITRQPPWRVALLGDSTVLILMHHALYDAHSLPLLLDDLNSHLSGSVSSSSTPPSVDSVVEYILSVNRDQAKVFWRQTFEDVSIQRPFWQSEKVYRGPETNHRARSSLKLRVLEKAAAKLKVTLSALVSTAIFLSFARALQSTELVGGLVLWGRSIDLEDATEVVAPCITTVPIPLQRCLLDAAKVGMEKIQLSDVITASHRWTSSAMLYQHTSMRDVRKWANLDRKSLVDLLFSFVQHDDQSKTAKGWSVQEIEAETDLPAAVEVVANRQADELQISAAMKYTLECSSLQDVVERACLILETIAADSHISIESLGVLFDPRILKDGSVLAMDSQTEAAEDEGQERKLTPIEAILQNVTAEVAGVDRGVVGINTPLIRFGIDSIAVLRLAARLRKDHGLHISAHDILASETIHKLAGVLKEKEKGEERADSITSSGDEYTCTPLQAGMINGTLASPRYNLYIHHHCFILNKDVDLERLEIALRKIVDAHEILRTSFKLVDAAHELVTSGPTWRANVHPRGRHANDIVLQVHCTAMTAAQFASQVGEDFAFASAKSFEYPANLWRATVALCSDGQRMFAMTMHHSLYDGVSLPALFNDLKLAYEAEVDLPLRVPFSWAAKRIADNQVASVEYWDATLRNFEHPALLVRKSQLNAPYRLAEVQLDSDLGELKSFCSSQGTSMQAVVMLAWAKVLCHCLRQRDVCFGHVVSGRFLDLPGIEDISGPLINTVPMRFCLDAELFDSSSHVARKLHTRIVQSQPHQHAPLSTIQSRWRRNHASRSQAASLFDSLFVFHNAEEVQSASEQSNSLWTSFNISEGESGGERSRTASEYPVNISVVQDAHGIKIKAGASDAVQGPRWLPHTLEVLKDTIMDILQKPERPSGSFPQGLATLPLQAPTPAPTPELATERRYLTQAERLIVTRHTSKRLGVDHDTIVSSPNLFLLGLDSLLAICISADARGEKVSLTAHDILSAGALAKMTITDAESDDVLVTPVPESEQEEALELLDLSVDDVDTVLPVLVGQQQHIELWLAKQRRFFEPTFIYDTGCRMDVVALDKAWKQLRRRNEVLRTVFARTKSSNELLQVALKADSIVWENCDRSRLQLVEESDSESRDDVAMAHLRNLNADPTDFFSPSPRLSLIRGNSNTEEGDLLLLSVHHSCYDAWSMRLMVSELCRLYKQAPLAPAPISFSHFVKRTQTYDRGFWQTHLQGAQSTLICNAEDSVEQTLLLRKSAVLRTDRIEEACRARGFGLQVVVILAYAQLLACRTGQEVSPTFGFYTAGRSSQLADVIGPTVTMHPFTVSLSHNFEDVLQGIQRHLVDRTQHEQTRVPAGIDVAFDAHLNLLWHKPASTASTRSWKPYRLPRDSGYLTSQPRMPGKTSVDHHTDQVLSRGKAQLYMDVSLDHEAHTLSLGARVDAVAMDAPALGELCDELVENIHRIAADL